MHQLKAISPIIATIIILLVTIAIAGAGYSYISTYWAGLVGKEIQVVSSFCTGEGQAKIMMRNIGTNPVRTGEITIINPNTGEDITNDVVWASSVGIDPNLVLELKFEEGSGTEAKDTSGKGNDGTINGNPQWVEGKVGEALSFDGNDYVDCGEDATLYPSHITVSAWVKTNSAVEQSIVAGYGVYKGYMLLNSRFSVYNGIIGTPGGSAGYSLETGRWTHIVGTFDGANVKVYKDGVLQSMSPYDSLVNGGVNVIIGKASHYDGTYFSGLIDEVRIYSRALSPEEIAVLAGNFQVQPGDTATFTHACPGRCRYNLVLGGAAKEAMVEC